MTTPLGDAFRRLVRHRRWPLVIALLAAVIHLPALGDPKSTDDLILHERLLDPELLGPEHYGRDLVPAGSNELVPTVMGLFDWVGPDRQVRATTLIDAGVYPWWASEGFFLAFWRPLSSFTHWLDYRLWPLSNPRIHAHGILWFALAAAAVALAYRRLGTGGALAAGLAALLFALDEHFFFPVSWMSNRNVLLALFFGAAALLAHHDWRAHGSLAGAVAAPLLLLASLLSGEPGVATAAYLGAYAIAYERGGWLGRAASLAPAVAVTVGWRLAYQAMDYGALETGLYLDPGREPLRFLEVALVRGPLLLVGQLGWPDAELWEFLSPAARPIFYAAAWGFLAVAAVFLGPLVRRSREARFWSLGMLLAVAPICATSPVTDRRLFFVAIGGAALTGLYLAGMAEAASWRPRARLWRLGAWAFAAGLVVVQLALPVRAFVLRASHPQPATVDPQLDLGADPRIAGQEAVLVTAPNTFLTVYLPWELARASRPVPTRTRLLAPAFTAIEATRPAADVLRLRAVEGTLMEIPEPPSFDPADDVYALRWTNEGLWSGDFPLAPGERRELPGLVAEVVEAGAEGLPVEVLFRFSSDLGDPSRRWLYWSWEERIYRPFPMPEVGGTVRLAGPFG